MGRICEGTDFSEFCPDGTDSATRGAPLPPTIPGQISGRLALPAEEARVQGEVGQKEPVQQQDPKSLSFRPEEAEVTAEEEVCCALLVLYDLFWWYMGLFECYIGLF